MIDREDQNTAEVELATLKADAQARAERYAAQLRCEGHEDVRVELREMAGLWVYRVFSGSVLHGVFSPGYSHSPE